MVKTITDELRQLVQRIVPYWRKRPLEVFCCTLVITLLMAFLTVIGLWEWTQDEHPVQEYMG